MSHKTQLARIPSFVYYPENEDGLAEPAIIVEYYNGTVCFSQEGNQIIMPTEEVKAFCKSVLKDMDEAQKLLNL